MIAARAALVAGLAAILGAVAGCPGGSGGPAPRGGTTGETAAAPPSENLERSSDLDAFFSTELTRWLVVLSGTPDAAERPEIPTSLGQPARASLEELFAAAEAVARHRRGDEPEPPDLTPLTDRVNRSLRAQGLGYAIDSFVTDGFSPEHPHAVLLFTFELERERTYRDDSGRSRAVAWARRLDDLAYRYRLIGFTSKDREPLILVESIDELLCVGLLGHDAIGGAVSGQALAAAALETAAAIAPTARELAGALAARRALFARWNRENAASGAYFKLPTSRRLDPKARELLADVVAPADLATLAEIEKTLAGVSAAAAYDAIHRLLVVATEHHELQHQIDLEAGLSSDLALEASGETRAFVLAEVSAILAEMARAPRTAHLTLARVAPVALDPTSSLERMASRAALGQITGEPADLRGEELDVQIKALALMSDEAIGEKSKTAWQRLFGRPLPSLELER